MNPVKSKAESRLRSYNDPKSCYDIIEHYNREIESEDGYCKRPLLELLQNIEDALVSETQKPQEATSPRALFKFEHDCLWAANKGVPFDVEGFESLCDSNRSAKKGRDFIGNKGTGFKAVLNWTDTPEIHSDIIHARFNRKEAERLIREKIGDKRYENMIGKSGWRGQAPLLRVPLKAEKDGITRELLDNGWVTVVKLPVRRDKVAEVCTALKEFDPVNLLFLRHLSRIRIELDGETWEIAREKKAGNVIALDGTKYTLFQTPARSVPSDEKNAGKCEIAIAFPHELKDAGPHPMFNFFPIGNASAPFTGLLIHATFLLEANRDDLGKNDVTFHENLTGELATMLKTKVIPAMVKRHDHQCLRFFNKHAEPDNEHLAGIHRILHEAVEGCAFVTDLSGEKRTPRDVRIWKHGLGGLLMRRNLNPQADDGFLCHPDWQCELSGVLTKYGAREIKALEHVRALQPFVPTNDEEACEAMKAALAAEREIPRDKENSWGLTKNPEKGCALIAMRKLRLWKGADGEFRNLAEGHPFFVEFPKGLHDGLLGWLEADKLDQEFQKRLRENDRGEAGGHSMNLWDQMGAVRREYLFNAREFFDKAFLQAIEGKDGTWWQAHGNEALSVLFKLGKSADDENIWSDVLRKRASELVYVPVLEGGWKSAGKVYAGKAWYAEQDSPWGTKLAELEDRFLLADPDSEAFREEKDDWTPILRYVGVSWLPKLVLNQHGQWVDSKDDLESPISSWVPQKQWMHYVKECLHLGLNEFERDQSKDAGQWKVETSAFEGLNLMPTIAKSHGQILSLLKQLYETITTKRYATVVRRRGPYGGKAGFKTFEEKELSFPLWQLKHADLFLINHENVVNVVFASADRAAASEMFMVSGGSWRAWLPRLVLSDIEDENERRRLETFANEKLEVRYKPGDAPNELWWK